MVRFFGKNPPLEYFRWSGDHDVVGGFTRRVVIGVLVCRDFQVALTVTKKVGFKTECGDSFRFTNVSLLSTVPPLSNDYCALI
jgi:hypothetical protein